MLHKLLIDFAIAAAVVALIVVAALCSMGDPDLSRYDDENRDHYEKLP